VSGRPRLPGADPRAPRGIPPIPVVHGRVSSWPWAKSATFPAGSRGEQHFQLGEDPAEVGTGKRIQYGNVRCGFSGDEQAAENFTGWIILPDNGTEIGPIDLPFELTVPLPCRVRVRPDADPGADRIVVATVSIPPGKHRWAATRRVLVPPFAVPAVAVPIPQWVHSLSVCEQDAAVSLFDATGALLCAITGPVWDVPRPRAAVLLATTAVLGTSVLFSYQA